jgi:hypothetical protein
MFENKTRVLLILPEDVLERARVMAGRATTKLKLAVSLQIVLRALIEEGLKRADAPPLLANVENQARAVRRLRSLARRRGSRGSAPDASALRIAENVHGKGPRDAGYRGLERRSAARIGERTGGKRRR